MVVISNHPFSITETASLKEFASIVMTVRNQGYIKQPMRNLPHPGPPKRVAEKIPESPGQYDHFIGRMGGPKDSNALALYTAKCQLRKGAPRADPVGSENQDCRPQITCPAPNPPLQSPHLKIAGKGRESGTFVPLLPGIDPLYHKGGSPAMNDPKDHNKNGPGLSRRDFLRGSGVAAAATALATAPLPALAEEADRGKVPAQGPAAVKIKLNVNGKDISKAVEPRVTLLDALRNYMDVTGCKRVCDRGTCGACTVMLDGKVVYSCTMLALEAQGKKIKTAESLYGDGKVDPVPAAFVQNDAQQCGFCTPGFVVALRAALDKNPKATKAEIEEALAGNICRCGTYEQMRHAIKALCGKNEGKGG
jgi:xanthine dehydrogenase YagT iron-sulfur-binding subunit